VDGHLNRSATVTGLFVSMETRNYVIMNNQYKIDSLHIWLCFFDSKLKGAPQY
jgi:hypothetical protein